MSSVLAAPPVIPNFGSTSGCVKDNDTFCWDWFKDHWSTTFVPALWQHIELTLIAVAIGFVIAFVLGDPRAPLSRPDHADHLPDQPAVHDPVAGGVRDPGPDHRHQLGHRRDRAGLLHVADPVHEHACRLVRGVAGDRRRRAGHRSHRHPDPAGGSRCRWRCRRSSPGMRVAAVTMISLATIAAFVRAGGPRQDHLRRAGQQRLQHRVPGRRCAVRILALVADGLLAWLQRLLTPWASSRRSR